MFSNQCLVASAFGFELCWKFMWFCVFGLSLSNEVSFAVSHQAPEHLAVSEDACGVSAAILERTFYAAAHALLRARSPAFLGSTSKCQVQGRPPVVAPVHRRVLSQLPRCLHPLPVKDRRNNVCKREAAALALCPFQIFFSLFSSSVAEPQQKYSSSFFNQRLLHTWCWLVYFSNPWHFDEPKTSLKEGEKHLSDLAIKSFPLTSWGSLWSFPKSCIASCNLCHLFPLSSILQNRC